MERARVDGAELEFEVSGTGEPAVLVHGALIADAFRPLLREPRLSDRYRLILYRRRGYAGSSGVSGPVGIDEHAADCRGLLRYLRVERAHVVGHSFGGVIALQLALDAPDLVHSLALLEPALMLGSSAQAYRSSLIRAAERYREAGAAVAVGEFLEARSPGSSAVLDRVLPGALDQATIDAGTSFEFELPGLLGWRFGEAEARRIGHPTLSVLGGESGSLAPRFSEIHRLLLEWLPRAEGSVLLGATHLMQVEDPGGVAEALADFWARHRLPIDGA